MHNIHTAKLPVMSKNKAPLFTISHKKLKSSQKVQLYKKRYLERDSMEKKVYIPQTDEEKKLVNFCSIHEH